MSFWRAFTEPQGREATLSVVLVMFHLRQGFLSIFSKGVHSLPSLHSLVATISFRVEILTAKCCFQRDYNSALFIIKSSFLALPGHRHFGETNMNERSSRSHTIFRMVRLIISSTFLVCVCVCVCV